MYVQYLVKNNYMLIAGGIVNICGYIESLVLSLILGMDIA